MKIILDNSFGLVTAETICDPRCDSTPLLEYCSASFTVEGLSLLIARGANIHARDRHGRNCLHLCFVGLLPNIQSAPVEALKQFQSGLVYLLRLGADIFAVDDGGCSVSKLAYRSIDYGIFEGTSMVGDIWDVILAGYGFDVASFRKTSPRMALYGNGYTRRVFEELWTGQEHLCPYYDEEFWTTDEDSEDSGRDDGDESDYSSDSTDGGGGML